MEQALGPVEPFAEPEAAVRGSPGVGDTVAVEGIPQPGKVTALSGSDIEVEVGRLRMRVEPARVRLLMHKTAGAVPDVVSSTVTERPEAPAELNVIGLTAEEARERVDEYLDRAFLSGRCRLRVVHGHGKGILRRTLHDLLRSHAHVSKFYLAPANEGGTGATIVEVKS